MWEREYMYFEFAMWNSHSTTEISMHLPPLVFTCPNNGKVQAPEGDDNYRFITPHNLQYDDLLILAQIFFFSFVILLHKYCMPPNTLNFWYKVKVHSFVYTRKIINKIPRTLIYRFGVKYSDHCISFLFWQNSAKMQGFTFYRQNILHNK